MTKDQLNDRLSGIAVRAMRKELTTNRKELKMWIESTESAREEIVEWEMKYLKWSHDTDVILTEHGRLSADNAELRHRLKGKTAKCHQLRELYDDAEVRASGKQIISGMELARLWIADASPDDLRTLRAIINGKLSRRTISPEAQAKMQAAKLARAPRSE